MDNNFDYIVIGAGIAGASVAAHLAENASVVILEMEERPGYHTTGRSAAAYEPNYGPKPILAFARASGAFFNAPPTGFADAPLLTKRISLMLEPDSQIEFAAKFRSDATSVEEISASEIKKLWPVFRDGYASRGFLDHSTGDLDVDLLHRGYLKLFKARSGKIFLNFPPRKFRGKAITGLSELLKGNSPQKTLSTQLARGVMKLPNFLALTLWVWYQSVARSVLSQSKAIPISCHGPLSSMPPKPGIANPKAAK